MAKYLRSVILWFFVAVAASAATPTVYLVQLEQPSYIVESGKDFVARLFISPIPPAGLFSAGVTVTLNGNSVTGDVITATIPSALNFHTVLGAGATLAHAGRTAVAKGSVDFDLQPLQPYREALLATFSISPLTRGTYTLTVSPKNDLGKTEQIFVDGAGVTLDPQLRFASSKITVTGGLPLLDPPVLNRQTGLFEQIYRLTNMTDGPVTGQRLYVDLPDNVTLWNAWNILTEPDGRPYVVYTGTLAPGEMVELTLEYNVPGRLDAKLTPAFALGAAGVDVAPAPTGPVVTTSQGVRLPNGNVVVPFSGKAGLLYYVQYSTDQVTWHTVMPPVVGIGGNQQWLDNGPPKTPSKPLLSAPRTYRVQQAN